jgi:hypothetical protein
VKLRVLMVVGACDPELAGGSLQAIQTVAGWRFRLHDDMLRFD